MGFYDDSPPPLYVPDLSKPAGAVVAADGTVACVACGTRLPVNRMDVVGQGYRCAPCSHRADVAKLAHGAVDASSNFSEADRAGLRTSGTNTMLGGIGLAVLGVCLVAFLPRGGIALIIFGVSTAGVGASRKNAAG